MATPANQWRSPEHVRAYLQGVADTLPHRAEAEAALAEWIPDPLERVLDIGTGDGRLLAQVLALRPGAQAVGLDFSPAMLEAARDRFAGEPEVEIVEHDIDEPLPLLGRFDAVVSSFAIHHCDDQRKRSLYAEVYDLLNPGGAFLNLEHVASPTEGLHQGFRDMVGIGHEEEDPSNILLDVESQLRWLREIGFDDVDCHWKWREIALLAGVRPG